MLALHAVAQACARADQAEHVGGRQTQASGAQVSTQPYSIQGLRKGVAKPKKAHNIVMNNFDYGFGNIMVPLKKFNETR